MINGAPVDAADLRPSAVRRIRVGGRRRRQVMNTTTATITPDVLLVEFDLARLDLRAAIAAQRRRDTPAARREVADCRARIDAILDSWNAGVRLPL